MKKHIGYFGGKMHVRMIVEDGHKENAWFDRELWFDLDIDGRWLVGVNGPDVDDEARGSIVVRDPTVSAFIETLGKLIEDPAQFSDEPVLIDASWRGQRSDQ